MITFQTVNIPLPDLNYDKVKLWIETVAANHAKVVGNINYIFCDDAEILRVNREFLKHDYFTDIITFDYSHKNKISGDIFISTETVGSNACFFDQSYDRELLRVIIHGILHLCGIKDKGPGERQIMENEENIALDIYAI